MRAINNIRESYESIIADEINFISPNTYNRGFNIPNLPIDIGLKILKVLVESACLGQNVDPIMLARKQTKLIPQEWLIQFLPEVTKSCINFDDEWEYRRLLELVEEVVPKLLGWLIEQGKNSDNDEVQEASNDFLIRFNANNAK